MPINKNMNVLVVDDYSSMRKTMKTILHQLGFPNVLEAENGKVALSILKNTKIELVIADWNMPQMTGLELLKEIRSTPELHKIPVLMVTAEALVQNVVAAVKAGVNNYIVKPFDGRTLMDKINRIFPE